MFSLFLTYTIYISVLHLTILCYNLISFYILIDNKENYLNLYIVYNNYNNFKLLLKTHIKLVFYKELIFRVYMFEIMKYILYDNELIISWIIIYSLSNIYTHKYSNKIIIISNLIKTFIISNYLINVSIIESGLIHMYTELVGVVIQKYIFKIYHKPSIKTNTTKNKTIKDYLNIELSSKKDVEELLSTKKFN